MSGGDTFEVGKDRTNAYWAVIKYEFANRALMAAAALLHYGESLVDAAGPLEVAEEQDGVGEIADIDRCLRGSDESVLGHCDGSHGTLLAEVGEDLMQLHGQKLLIRHSFQEAVDAVDYDDTEVSGVDETADARDE